MKNQIDNLPDMTLQTIKSNPIINHKTTQSQVEVESYFEVLNFQL